MEMGRDATSTLQGDTLQTAPLQPAWGFLDLPLSKECQCAENTVQHRATTIPDSRNHSPMRHSLQLRPISQSLR